MLPRPPPYFSISACSGVRAALRAASSSGVGPARAFLVFWRMELFFEEEDLEGWEEEASLASLRESAVVE